MTQQGAGGRIQRVAGAAPPQQSAGTGAREDQGSDLDEVTDVNVIADPDSNSLLVMALPDRVSGSISNGSVSLSDCWPDFQSTSQPLTFAAQYVSPAWVGPAVTVNGSPLPTDGSSITLTLAFDATCSAPLQVAYQEAGEIAISAAFTGSGALSGLDMLGGDNLVFYPAALIAQATNGSGTPLNAATAGAMPIHVAAGNFTLSIRAVNSVGAVTRGYQPQAADRLLAYAQRTGPTSGFEGTLRVKSPPSNV